MFLGLAGSKYTLTLSPQRCLLNLLAIHSLDCEEVSLEIKTVLHRLAHLIRLVFYRNYLYYSNCPNWKCVICDSLKCACMVIGFKIWGTLSLGLGALTDICTAAALCFYLQRIRKSSSRLVHRKFFGRV